MRICGVKLTHDGAIALIEDGRLVFCIEMEKLNNQPRYEQIEDTALIGQVLAEQGYAVTDIDYFAVDGWGGNNEEELAIQPRLTVGKAYNQLDAANEGEPYKLAVGQYEEGNYKDALTKEWSFDGLRIGSGSYPYFSYLHAAAHVAGTYFTSDFARRQEAAYVLVWDGGMYPKLYFYDPHKRDFESLGPIFLMIGNMYTLFAQHFGPFKVKGGFAKDDLSIAGKVMAYIAKGQVNREWFAVWDDIYRREYTHPMGFGNVLARSFKQQIEGQAVNDEDILCTFHAYLEEKLIEKLKKKIDRDGKRSSNLCLSGGCALNIKWNSAIRESGIAEQVYVPPFPNDSGSAIGAACCTLLHHTGQTHLEWDVYSGPQIKPSAPGADWSQRACDIKEVAQLLHDSNEPIIFLHGRAELGPRALGNRSMLAAATSSAMKGMLNEVKQREEYRPVSPICLEHRAQDIFTPGGPDPYMLYDHDVKAEWKDRIPAVMHLDGTARLQTVSQERNPTVFALLEAYERLSGVPLLCNTSANDKGKGFFPDAASAAAWGKVNYIWCDHTLYERDVKLSLHHIGEENLHV